MSKNIHHFGLLCCLGRLMCYEELQQGDGRGWGEGVGKGWLGGETGHQCWSEYQQGEPDLLNQFKTDLSDS